MEGVAPQDVALVGELGERLGLVVPAVTPLLGGTRNRSYRLRDARQDLVLRVAGEHDREYAVAREAEFAAQRLAASAGLAPPLLVADARTGVSVTGFVPGPPWTREQAASTEGSARAGAWMARLHALPVTDELRPVRFLASLEAYAGRLVGDESLPRLLDRARHVAADLGERARVPCHNDLHHLNLLDSPHGLVAIDWEYAGAGDPRMDLAGYAAYHDLGDESIAVLLRTYGGRGSAIPPDELAQARWLFEAVWWAWLELRRRLERGEPAALADTRGRLQERLHAPADDR